VKRSGSEESVGVVIQMFTEAMLGISLYTYLYLKLAKMPCLSYYLFSFLFKIGEVGKKCSVWKGGGLGEGKGRWGRQKGGPNNVYTYE
jgi:hypothetical protein